MKNIRINRKKIKKLNYVLVPVAMTFVMMTTGCSMKNNDTSNFDMYSGYYNENTNTDKLKDCQMNRVSETNSRTPINFTNDNYLNFNNYLSTLQTNYEYSNIYNFSAAIKEYNKLKNESNHKIKLNALTIEELFNVVKKNNENKKDETAIYKEISDEELKKICSIIVNTINAYVENNSKISIEKVKCVLSDLKIFKQNSAMCNAFVTSDNYMIVSPNMLDIAQMINGNQTDEDVIVHEIMHILQKECNCDLAINPNLKENLGVSYNFKNLDVNSLKFSWLYEASAEKHVYNYTGHNVLTYKTMISYLESLSLVNILNSNYEVNGTENLSFKRGLDSLYEYFGAMTETEKQEVLNLMYSIEVMQQEPYDFYDEYEKKYGIEKNEKLRDEINYNVKSSICTTLTKLFYRNLSKSITNKEVTLEDIYYMMCLYENDLNSHLVYDNDEKMKYNSEFIDIYVSIQDNFFYELSKCLNFSQEEIENSFYKYCANKKTENGNIVKNCDLNFLSESKINYLSERQKELSDEATMSIREVKNTKKNVYN